MEPCNHIFFLADRFFLLPVELFLFGPDGEHGAGRSPDHPLGYAAEEQVFDASPPVGSHDNEIHAFRCRVFRDLNESGACPYRPCHGDPRRCFAAVSSSCFLTSSSMAFCAASTFSGVMNDS